MRAHLGLTFLLAASALQSAWAAEPLNVTTIAGSTVDIRDGYQATTAPLDQAYSATLDTAGNMYIAEVTGNRVRKVAPDGIISTIAGTGVGGTSGDGILATESKLNSPRGATVDPSGRYVYISENFGFVIRQVDTHTGLIKTIAGPGTLNVPNDGGDARQGFLNAPFAVALDAAGNVFIPDPGAGRVRKVDVSQDPPIITTVAGGGSGLGENGPATAANMNPNNLAFDGQGNLYLTTGNRVRKVATGDNHVLDGLVRYPMVPGGCDPSSPTSEMVEISTMVAPGITALVKFCRDPGETITTIVNNSPTNVAGSTGDGGLATAATLNSAWGVAVDGDVLYVSELTGNRVRKVLLTGARTISLYAGTGAGGLGDEGAATSARLSAPRGLFAGNGNLYIGDNANNRIRKIDGGGIITTVAGGGVIPTGDGGPATAAHFGVPFGAAVGPDGSLYVGEVSGHRVRRIYPSGLITTVAGTGVAGFTADGLPATESMINAPFDVTVDPSGNVYFTDYNNNLVRKVAASTGLLSTVAGNRVAGTTGDGGNALNAAVNGPQGLAIGPGPAFDLFISTTGNPRVRKVSMATGVITTIAGNASVNGGGLGDTVGDNGGATSAGLATPRGIAFDAAGNLYIANISNRVRKVTPGDNLVMDGLVPYPMVPGGCDPASPTSEMAELPTFVPPNTLTTTLVRWCRDPGEDISTFVGASGDVPVAGVTGDGGQARDARLNTAFGVAVDETQNVYIVEMGGARVRKVDPSGIITTIAGSGVSGFSGDGGPATAATFNGPRDVVVDDAGNVYVIDGSNNRIRRLDLAAKSVSINIDADGDGGIAAMAELFSVRSPSTLGDASLRTVDAQGAATSAAPVSGTADPRPDPFDAQKKVYAFGPDDGRLAGNRFRLESRFDDQRTFSGDARFFIAWHPAHMLYGAPLSSAQLDASASVPGSFTFHMAAGDVVGGAVLAPGKDQPIAAHFTPADASLGTADWTARIDVLYQGAGTTCFGAPGHAILPPIHADGTSVFRKGSTVLAKLRVCDANGVSLGTPGVVVSFRLVRIIAGTVTDVNEPVESGTPDQAFRWDAGAMQWLFNIDTSDLDKDTTYVFEATLGDGTSVRFQFGLR